MVLATEIAGPAEALKRLASSRDADAWAWLLAEVGPEIQRVAMRLTGDAATADDAVQECLLTLRDHAGRFQARTDPDRDAMRWIMRVAANAALQVARGRRRAAARDHDHATASPTDAADPVGAGLERDETARLVRGELSRLGESERAAIVLHVVAGMSFDQVAAELRCPVGTAKVRVHRGLERLRRRLGRRANDLPIAGVVARLQQGDPSSATATLSMHHALLGSPARVTVQAVHITIGAITIGALTMATKLALTAAFLLVVAAPISMRLLSQESQPITTTAIPASQPIVASTVAEMMDRKVTYDFLQTPLEDFARLLTATGVPCVIDGQVVGPLTLSVKDMPVRDLMKWVTVLCNASMKVSSGSLILFPTPADQRVLLDQELELRASTLAVDDALDMVRLATGIAIVELMGTDRTTKVAIAAGTRKAGDILADIAKQSANPYRIDASGASFGPLLPGPVQLAQAPAEIAAALAQKVTLDFQDTDLADTVGFLRQITKLNVVVDPKVMAMQLKSVTLRSEDKPLSEVFEAIASVNGLSVQWVDQAVFITIGDAAPPVPTHTF